MDVKTEAGREERFASTWHSYTLKEKGPELSVQRNKEAGHLHPIHFVLTAVSPKHLSTLSSSSRPLSPTWRIPAASILAPMFHSPYDSLSLLSCSIVSDGSPPGSSVHGILQARILAWTAIPFSRGSSPTQGMGCHFFLQGIFLTQGWNLDLPHWGQILYCLSHRGSPFPPLATYSHLDIILCIKRFKFTLKGTQNICPDFQSL